jgi:hypothetical protein
VRVIGLEAMAGFEEGNRVGGASIMGVASGADEGIGRARGANAKRGEEGEEEGGWDCEDEPSDASESAVEEGT